MKKSAFDAENARCPPSMRNASARPFLVFPHYPLNMSVKKPTCNQPLRVADFEPAPERNVPLEPGETRHDFLRALDAKKLRTCSHEGCETIVLSSPFCWRHRNR
jgi:hypothetical protein